MFEDLKEDLQVERNKHSKYISEVKANCNMRIKILEEELELKNAIILELINELKTSAILGKSAENAKNLSNMFVIIRLQSLV